jgi:glycosyltransferase involved in cell wall biosynthesis
VYRGLNATSPQLLALYRDASAFVLPTRGDCFSIAGLEAMAMGLPLVISGVGGIPELVEDERSGYLIAPRDGQGLRRALEALVGDPERARGMGLRGRALVEQRFDARLTADRLMALLDRVARRPGPGAAS